jgi:hypothetical protein
MRWAFDATADKAFYARLTSFADAGSRNRWYFRVDLSRAPLREDDVEQ